MGKKTVTIKLFNYNFCILTFLLFMVLKLTGQTMVADWSWWWVTSPLWLPFAALLALIVIICLVMGVVGMIVLIFDR